jgi:DNA-binding winged helix-turn-helix (wHTH) protein
VDRSFNLGEWRVEPALNRVSGPSGTVPLEPRAMELLMFLARHPGQVLSRETLIDGVWQQEFVGEAVLRNSVSALRRALGDDARNPRLIETISKRGYRLIAPVDGLESEDSAASASCFTVIWEDAEIVLNQGENLVGRGQDATIRIESSEVSRRHARFVVDGDTVTLEDLASKNGTHRNGRRVDKPVRLADGDEIWIGLKIASLRLQICDDRTRTER